MNSNLAKNGLYVPTVSSRWFRTWTELIDSYFMSLELIRRLKSDIELSDDIVVTYFEIVSTVFLEHVAPLSREILT